MTMKIEGMMCGGCEKRVEKALMQVPGVIGVKADHSSNMASLDVDITVFDSQQAKNAVEDLGFDCISLE